MSITVDESEARRVIRLGDNIDITSCVELKPILIEALSLPQDIEIDLTQASTLDVTAIQLLWATAHSAQRNHKHFSAAGPIPDHIGSLICEAGFDQFLTPTTTDISTPEPVGSGDKADG